MKKLYFAVNGCGRECVFTTYPVRDDHFKVWTGEIVAIFAELVRQMESEGLISLPALTWNDEPVAMEIAVNVV